MRKVAIVLGASFLASAPSWARTRADVARPAVCAPACPSSFVCAPNGRCVSACNPPCSEREQCLPDGSCTDLVPPTISRPPAAPLPVASVTAERSSTDAVAPLSTAIASPVPSAPAAVFGASLGGAYVPPFSGPGSTWAGFLEVDLVKTVSHGDYRLGALFAYASTYYETSTHAALVGRSTWDLSSVYAVGSGIGLGYGSFSTKEHFNGDNGGSLTVLGDLVPMLLRLGPSHNLELSLHGGIVYAFSFGGVNPFGGVTFGFVTH